eukprot:scaffold707_cov399-Prasinococcus_capsulatus_cf.AAC.9
MMRISNETVVNVRVDHGAQLRRYEREIQHLKDELALYDEFNTAGEKTYAPYSNEQRATLRAQVLQFLQADKAKVSKEEGGDSLDPIELISARHVREALLQCRQIYRHVENASHEAKAATGTDAARETDITEDGSSEGRSQVQQEIRPTRESPANELKDVVETFVGDPPVNDPSGAPNGCDSPVVSSGRTAIDPEAAFRVYIAEEGMAIAPPWSPNRVHDQVSLVWMR